MNMLEIEHQNLGIKKNKKQKIKELCNPLAAY